MLSLAGFLLTVGNHVKCELHTKFVCNFVSNYNTHKKVTHIFALSNRIKALT